MSGLSISEGEAAHAPVAGGDAKGGFGATLTLTAAALLGGALGTIAVTLLVVHPPPPQIQAFATVVNLQSQGAKTFLYLAAFLVLLPAALVGVPRLADRIAAGPNAAAFPALSAAIAAGLAIALVVARVSASLPWGDGLGTVLAAVAVWALGSGAALIAAMGRPRPLLLRLAGHERWAGALGALCAFCAVLCVTRLRTLSAAGLILGGAVLAGALLAHRRLTLPRLPRRAAVAIDAIVIVLLLLAIPDTVIFRTSPGIPTLFFEPGTIAFQQDWILGPVNQLLHGGALLVADPPSQYGVGLLYFLAGWFHIAPIGYGTFGFLDGVLTAAFYAAGYLVLRLARVSRPVAIGAMGVAVVALVYDLHFRVGALPEQGPLRFGFPMALLVAAAAGARWPERAAAARVTGMVIVGIASTWSVEAFGYTSFTFLALMAFEAASLGAVSARRRFAVRMIGGAIAACVCAQVLFALVTLAGSGQLPHWSQYLAYLHALLLGGKEGSTTYGFERWSPGLGVAAIALVSASAIALLTIRRRQLVIRERVRLLALSGTTAYAIAVFSYFDNRSSTYLLLYLALPTVMIATLWLDLLLRARIALAPAIRTAALGLAGAVAVVLVAAAWPAVGGRFSNSALAHLYPGGGLRAAIHRLWHAPPIDPRAPEGARLVKRYLPGERVIVLLPKAQDLSIELLMRSDRANALFIGDGYMDSFVPSVWRPIISRQIAALRPGRRLLSDRDGLRVIATLAAHPAIDPLTHPVDGGVAEQEWALAQIARRFELRPTVADRDGFVVLELERRKVLTS